MNNRRTNFGIRILSILLILLMIFTSIPSMSLVALADELSGEEIATEPRYELNFNKNWKFNYGDVPGADSIVFSDKSWETVNLPHDFSIKQDFTLDGTEGESGSLPGGTGWYRKSFVLPNAVHDRVFRLNFGASYSETTVYVNGSKIGENFNGYNSFSFDISNFLFFDGETPNVIAVKVVNNIPSSRWYSGSGLIGDVTLSVLRAVHVGLYGTQITTPDLAVSNGTDGTTNINVEIHNPTTNAETIRVVADILNPAGEVVASSGTTEYFTLEGKTEKLVSLTAEVPSPALWSVDTPNLYKVRVRIEEYGEILDEYYDEFGYTWSSWSETEGFSLNGKKLKLQGVSMHLDQGGLGAVQEYDAVYRQISMLKEMGVNAIRGTHNVFPEMYIDICNKLGVLFMEEMFDGWYTSKNGNIHDFSKYFNVPIDSQNHVFGGNGQKWYQFVISQTIKRDRNNPCIIAWDVGNELAEPDFNDTTVAADIKNIVDSLDSRPMLWGNNNGVKTPIDNYMDVFGGNYRAWQYNQDHTSYGMPFVGSETASALGSRGYYKNTFSDEVYDVHYAASYQVNAYDASPVSWGNTAAEAWHYSISNDWHSGEFVWTGFDYIGEPTPWNYDYLNPGNPDKTDINAPVSSFFGIIDTAGFAKDSYYLYNSFWDKDETTLHLVPGTWNRENLVVDSSGYTDVAIYTNAPYVELLYNGNIIATATGTTYTTTAGHSYTLYDETIVDSSKCKTGELAGSNEYSLYPLFDVKYDSSARLSVKAYTAKNGTEIRSTVGKNELYANTADSIRVSAWNADTTLTADGDSFNYIEITALDAEGNFANDYNGTVDVKLISNNGAGIIAAVDNGNASTNDKFQSSTALLSDTSARIKMFNGKALVIVQSTENTGAINVTVTPEDLEAESIGLTSYSEKDSELTDEFEEVLNQELDKSHLDNKQFYDALKEIFNNIEAPGDAVSYVKYVPGQNGVEDGQYVIMATSAEVGMPDYVMTSEFKQNRDNTITGFAFEPVTPEGNTLKTSEDNEVTIKKVSGSTDKYTIQMSTGKYLYIDIYNLSQVKESNTPVETTIKTAPGYISFNLDDGSWIEGMDASDRVNIYIYEWNVYFHLSIFAGSDEDSRMVSHYTRQPNGLAVYDCFALYRKTGSASAADIDLYNAIEKAMQTNYVEYEVGSYAALLDEVQDGLAIYGDSAVSEAEKIAATTAITTAYKALEKNSFNPTIKKDIENLPEPNQELYYQLYEHTQENTIPAGDYLLYATHERLTNHDGAILTNTEKTVSSRIKGLDFLTVDLAGNNDRIDTAEVNEWTITPVTGKSGKYYIQDENGRYLDCDTTTNSDGNARIGLSALPVEFDITYRSDTGKFVIADSGHVLDLFYSDGVFAQWGQNVYNTNQNEQFHLFKKVSVQSAEKKALYDLLKKCLDVNYELYTAGTYESLLEAMQIGYNVYTNENATEDEVNSAISAVNKALDALRYLNLRPVLEAQILALVPPKDSEAEYSEYTAGVVHETIIPDGDYVISLDYNKRGTEGCWGVMTTNYVVDDGWFWDGMGWQATYADPVVSEAVNQTWKIERDEASGNYLISRMNKERGYREYLYIPNKGNNDNCEMSGASDPTKVAAYWKAEIDVSTGLVRFVNAANSAHLITFCGKEAYDADLVSKSVPLYVSAYQEGKSSGGKELRLQRIENGQLIPWYAPVEDGKYIITYKANTDAYGTPTSLTYICNTISGNTAGTLQTSEIRNITSGTVKAYTEHEVEFIRVEGTNHYYIKNGENYLNIDYNNSHNGTGKLLIYSENPQELAVKAYSDGRIAVYNPSAYNTDNYIFLDKYGSPDCYSTWGESMSNSDQADNRHFRLYKFEKLDAQNDTRKLLYNKLLEAIVIDQENYSDDSYNNLLYAIKNGIESYNDDILVSEWQAAIDAIDKAIHDLEIAKATFPATLYKYGYSPTADYSSGGNYFNEITYNKMAELIRSTPELLEQVKTVVGYDSEQWSSILNKEDCLKDVINEYAKLYSLAFLGKPVADTNTSIVPYQTFWNVWEKPGTWGSTDAYNDGASVQGLFSTTLGTDRLPGSHDAYDVLPYINTDDTNVAGIHFNHTFWSNQLGRDIILPPLENISVYIPDFFSRNDILSEDSNTYAKYYWDTQFPFVEYTNMFGVHTYVYDSSDKERIFQASYDDVSHIAKAQLTEIDADSELGKVWGTSPSRDGRGFFPFNNRLDGNNSSMINQEAAIYHFGMSFSTEFYIPTIGHYGDGQDIVFEFSGDDDVLVYVDDVLILDNGGLHGPRYSNINFTKKSVSYQFLADSEKGTVINPNAEGVTYSYGEENEGITAQNQAAIEYLNKIATDGQQHTFTFFYLERGATDSNCKLMFNIQKISDYVKLNGQSYVVDYGLPVEFDVTENNVVTAPPGYEFASYNYIGITDTVPEAANSLVMFTEPTDADVIRFGNKSGLEFQGNFGTYIINKNGTVKYTPQTMQFKDAGSIYMCARVEHDPTYRDGTIYYAFEKITIIPATTIYYEDDFQGDGITYTDGTIPTGEVNASGYGIWQYTTSPMTEEFIYQHADQPGEDDANNYGYDSVYDECTMYSGYSSKYVTVSAKNNPQVSYSGGAGASWPTAEFTFAGTGFDLISVTSKDTGTINLTVKNTDGKIVKNHTVNTYYGYSYGQIYRAPNGKGTLTDTGVPLYFTTERKYSETPAYYAADGTIVTENTTGDLEPAFAKGWLLENAVTEDNALYQIPVMKVNGLDYGTYTVTITPMYSSRMDMQKDGAYDFYVDAIRIYNPAGIGDSLTNSTISYAYTQDREANADYLELRNMLIGSNKLTDGTSAKGAVFIDGISDNEDVSIYTSGGPNNELYLLKNQAVSFQIWASTVPDDIQISAKAVGSKSPELFVSYNTTADTYTAKTKIKTSTDLYYSVDGLLRQFGPGQLRWTPVEDTDGNRYYSSGVIVIQNISDGIISITNLKWTFPSAGYGYFENFKNGGADLVSEEPVMLMSDYATFRMARSSLRAVNADLEIGQDNVRIENDTVLAGESITVNVTTSSDVASLVIRDEKGNVITPEAIESFMEIIDNKEVKQWTVTLGEDEAGTYTYTLTGAYENGFESENPVEITVTVENAPQPEEKPEEPDEEPDKESQEELTFFEKLVGFFRRLIDFFNSFINMLVGK